MIATTLTKKQARWEKESKLKCRKDTIKIRILRRTTHARLKKTANRLGISMQELVEKLSTIAL